eukprot:CAMPEP_0180535530 /NCGR_PEP_ID=MMETSP1036_2-20121128/64782_1 /TAXON_ID=632150 /ORGANISM="Azadinium spinosum, Strain 3D9" /LENGTH=33 /DNA_ID= /DNA_START= /DNA_END= /DNA_ORIENTATION=
MPRQNALHSGEHTAGKRLSKHHVHLRIGGQSSS